LNFASPDVAELPAQQNRDRSGWLAADGHAFRSPLSSGARIVKRASDLFIAVLALTLLSPLWLLIALLIKLDSRGPVFYKQERVGMDGPFFFSTSFGRCKLALTTHRT